MARNPSVTNVLRWLTPNPRLPEGKAKYAADACHTLAVEMPEGKAKYAADACYTLAVEILNAIDTDSAELTTGLRKLLEAKDCFVRAALDA